MAPTKRKALRKNIQLRDENGDEYADGSSQHDLPLQGDHGGGISQYNNIRGSTSVEDDGGLVQEEHSINGLGNLGRPTKQKARGPTYMKHIWAIRETSERIKLEVNELGQLIGDSTGQFSEFLGTVAKNGAYAPVNIKR